MVQHVAAIGQYRRTQISEGRAALGDISALSFSRFNVSTPRLPPRAPAR